MAAIQALAIGFTISHAPALVVDGLHDATGYGSPLAVQATPTNWDIDNFVANFHAVRGTGGINVFMGCRAASGNAILLFIDSKPGGQTFIPNNLITSGGEGEYINNLGSSPTAGMTFEAGFEPDYALRIYGVNADAHVNQYNLQLGNRIYLGNAGIDTQSGGIVSAMRVSWANLTGTMADHAAGVEIALNMDAMGVPPGDQSVKFMAVLVTSDSNYGSNQVIASRTSTTQAIGDGLDGTIGLKNIDFETEPGAQTMELLIDGDDTDGDGLLDFEDPDDDNDGLLDTVETDTGIYVDENDTGTDPLIADSDQDGLLDGDEVYLLGTDPNKSDTDGDGLNDRVELQVYFCNPLLRDSDNDGFDDLFEVTTGFNPALDTSTPDALSSIRTAVEFRFNAANGISYRIEVSTDLNEWNTLETDIIGEGGVVTRFYSIENQPKRFLRARRN
jgi:hypothetical protein